mmetsp:Transcript_21106/g.29576  ORF Transcript_21106/g.29576 Transcript_21106/m.29576 type:complete len:285 (+) Transcript_21106:203-1057(+)
MTQVSKMYTVTILWIAMFVLFCSRVQAYSSSQSQSKPQSQSQSQLQPQLQSSKHIPFNSNTHSRKAFVRKAIVDTCAICTTSSIAFQSFTSPAYAKSPLPPTGVKAPNFQLPSTRSMSENNNNDNNNNNKDGGERNKDDNNNNTSSSSLVSLETLTKEGKWTVLYFYPGAFTSGCTLEARGFQSDLSQYQSLNAQIVGISVDSVEKNAKFCQEEQLDFYMLTDEGGRVSKLYGSALSMPGFGTFSNRQTYLIDPEGNLRWVFTDVESHVGRHSKEVLEKLSELS